MSVLRLNIREKQVAEILKRYPETRNDDFLLFQKLIEEYCVPFERSIHSFKDLVDALRVLPKYSDIERHRRKIQGRNEYLPTNWWIAQKRRINADRWNEYAVQERVHDLTTYHGNIPKQFTDKDIFGENY